MGTRKPAVALTFLASIPPLQSAFTFDGVDGAARIKLDVPASHADAVDRLRREFRGKAFRGTVALEPGEQPKERRAYR